VSGDATSIIKPLAPRLFHLFRDNDESGVSGLGRVAEGVLFANGKVVLSWNTKHTSVAVYDSMEQVTAIHSHGGKTRVVFDDDCLGCGHPLADHWGDGCGGCMFNGVKPANPENAPKACMCALMNHPEFAPETAW
jgi:hypothetical protein